MTYEFKLADLGEGMHEAEIVQWLIDVGDTAKLDQAIAKVETDKAVVELPSPVTGRVSEIRVKDGQTAKVGDVLVVFETSAGSSGDGTPKSSETSAAATSSAPTNMSSVATSSSQSAPSVAARPRVQAAPAVRKLAFELGVDLEQVTPSSASGRVSLEDVRAYAERAGSATSGAQNGASTAEVASTTAKVRQHSDNPL